MKELEQALIALAVIDKQVAEFLSSCGDEIFTEPVHRSIFNEIRSLISNNGSINPLIVAARLPESYRRILRSSMQLALETLDSQSRLLWREIMSSNWQSNRLHRNLQLN
jgi:replicative DNA helicase